MFLICNRISRPVANTGSADRWKTQHEEAPETSIVRLVSVSMPMDHETFRALFGRLPSAPHYLQVYGNLKFSVPVEELDNIMYEGEGR